MEKLTAPMIWIMQSGIYDVLQIYDLDGSGGVDYWEIWVNGSVAGTVVNDDEIVFITLEELGCTGTSGWNIGVMGRVNDSDEYVTDSSNFVAYYGDHSFDNNGADPKYGDTFADYLGAIVFYKDGSQVKTISSGTYSDSFTGLIVEYRDTCAYIIPDGDYDNPDVAISNAICSYDYGKQIASITAVYHRTTAADGTGCVYGVRVYAILLATYTETDTTYKSSTIANNLYINDISTRKYWELNSDHDITNEVYLASGMFVGQPYNHVMNDGSHEGNKGEIFNNYSSNIASGSYSHAEGSYTLASGPCSHAEGYGTVASGSCSHAEGYGTVASGSYSHAEGSYTFASGSYSHAEGSYTLASGAYSHAEGYGTRASNKYAHASGYETIAGECQTVIGKYSTYVSGPTSLTDTTASRGLFIVGVGSSDTSRTNGFRINPAGRAYSTASFVSTGADYAEYFEWTDGNPDAEDRRGRFVSLDNNKIRYATPEDDYILGIVSAEPSIVGDAHSEAWRDMYLRDVFGSRIQEVVEVEETTDENGVVIPAHTERRWVLNPDYDPEAKYASREERPEWDAVGIAGKLVTVDDGSCVVNGYCCPGTNGIATNSSERTEYRVIERIDDTHVRIFIK